MPQLLAQWQAIRRHKKSYADNPVGYAADILQVHWWQKQVEIAESLIEHKRVFVKASHSVGKSFLAAGLVNWFYDTFDPSVTLTTAPTAQQVRDVLWKEVRVQRKGRAGLQPKAPRLESSADHFALGFTASSGDAFQGRHESHVLIVFDEATGIDGAYWDAAESMMTGPHCYWLAIMNPTDTATRAYEEELSGKWHVITVSALEHPNLLAALSGEPVPYPSAVSLGWVRDRITEWCTPISLSEKRSGDIDFEGGLYRPGPLFEARVLGRWPTAGSTSVWTEAMWQASVIRQPLGDSDPLQIGCDVARFGDDFTSILVRRGNCALHHETHNGWDTVQTAGRLKELAKQYSSPFEEPMRVPIHIDDDGVGGGVVDNKGFWHFIPVSGAQTALQAADYPNKRSELWFACAERADEGRLDLSRLSPASHALIRRQVMAPTWKLDAQGRRVVEPKADTKKRIGRSPDDADALNLAYSAAVGIAKTIRPGRHF